MKKFFLIFLPIIFLYASESFKIDKIASNLGIVWGMDFIDENTLILTKKDGTILTLDLKNSQTKELLTIKNVHNYGQGGLLDIKVSPTYDKDNTVYFTYSKTTGDKGATTLAKAKFQNNSLTDFEDILVTNSLTDRNIHFGSRITFDEKGHIFFTIGDRGVRNNAQKLSNHAGSIIRLNLDGSIPKDNPFINKKDAMPEIYSYGHRNPQGIFYDKSTNKLWSIEHGPRGGDEINLVEKGSNYGWPVISYGKEYWAPLSVGEGTHKDGMQQPKKVYVPSIAPSSLIVYQGDMLKSLKGDILSGALKLRHLNKVEIDNQNNLINEERFLKDVGERIRNLVESKSGEIYISTDSGNIYKISSN